MDVQGVKFAIAGVPIGAYSIIIGRNNTSIHNGAILIGTGLTSQADNEIRIGHGEDAIVFTPESADYKVLHETLLSLVNPSLK